MKIGLQISSFSWPGGDAQIGPTLARICRAADDAGFDSIWVMDHLFQIRSVGELEEPMLEGTTALGFMAGHTKRARLGLMVGAIPYRQPGLWIKSTTTLDVLSEGRAWFGIGAAWNVEEARGAGHRFPASCPTASACSRTRSRWPTRHGRASASRGALQGQDRQGRAIAELAPGRSRGRACRSWSAAAASGRRCDWSRATATRATCLARPDMLRHKFAVLAEHCADVGRDYTTIERTNLCSVSITADGKQGSLTPSGVVERLGNSAEAGSHHTIFSVRNVWDLSKIEMIGQDVIPQVRGLGEPSPLDAVAVE